MKKDLYDTLGVDRKATDEEIKAAFKNKAKDMHPDKPGGSTEKMQELVHAHDILKSKHRRDRYDKTGQEDDHSFETQFNDIIQRLFINAVDASDLRDLERMDVVKEFKSGINNLISAAKEMQNQATLRAGKFKKIRSRLQSKGNQQVLRALDLNISDSESMREKLNYDLKFYEQCLLVLNDYNYTFDPPPERQTGRITIHTGNRDIDEQIEDFWNKRRKL